LSFVSTLANVIHLFGLFSLLLKKESLHLLLFLSEVFLLKFEHVNAFNVEVEVFIGLELFNLLIGLIFKRPVFLLSFEYKLINVKFLCRINFGFILLLHNLGSSVKKDLFIFVLAEILIDSLVTLLNDYLVEFQLNGLPLNDLLLYGLHWNKAVHIDLLLLANSVSSVHCLKIYLRVPVRIVDDNMVCRHQVYSKPTSTSWDQEDLVFRFLFDEFLDVLFSIFKRSRSIKATEHNLPHCTKIFDDVQSLCETRKDQNLLLLRQDFLEKPIDQGEFARGLYDMLSKLISALWLNTFKQVGMITHLSQLHKNIVVILERQRFWASNIAYNWTVASNLGQKLSI